MANNNLTQAQAIQYAQGAGFSGNGLATIVAIAQCESGLNPNATNTIGNTPVGSMDRGILQFNSYWHKDVSNSCAFNPQCAFQQAYKASNGGTNFNQWATFQNGCYKQHMNGVPTSTSSSSSQGSSSSSTLGSIPVVGGIIAPLAQPFINLMQEIGVFLIAITIIVLGVMVLWGHEITGFTGKAVKSAALL